MVISLKQRYNRTNRRIKQPARLMARLDDIRCGLMAVDTMGHTAND